MAKAVKTIKNMDPKVWNEIKAEAAKHNDTMSEFIRKLVSEHKKREGETQLDRILKVAPRITDEEAKEMKRTIAKTFGREGCLK